jgi:hypothetical protein
MVIVKINHGLGNQLFQYATGRSLARQLGTRLILDTSAYSSSSFRQYKLNHFGISQPTLNSLARFAIRKLRRRALAPIRLLAQNFGIIRLVKDKERGFDKTLPDQGKNLHLEGFWQSERYFADLRETLLTELTLPAPTQPEARRMWARMNEEISVCVHIRRGDYVSTKHGQTHWVTCGLEYYAAAMAYLGERVAGAKYYFFSDDPVWVQANFTPATNRVFVTSPTARSDIEDFSLMMNCRHFIIANSTFSWWAAWLGKQPDKLVIAPRNWYRSQRFTDKDLMPEHWIRL